jgi:hypothetical protein
MKTTFFIIGLVAFSALMLSPQLPSNYPSKAVLEQRKENVIKEKEIIILIHQIEYKIDVEKIRIEKNK